MGWPTQLIDGATNLSINWDMMEKGQAHLYPEVWRSEEDGVQYDDYVLKNGTVASAGKSLGAEGAGLC